MNASETNGSKAWCPPPDSHFSSGKGWSVLEIMSNPAFSAAAASSPIECPAIQSSHRFTARMGNWNANFMAASFPRLLGGRGRRVLGVLLLQHALVELSRVSARELGPEVERPRAFVTREPAAAVGQQLLGQLGARVGTVDRLDDGLYLLAHVRVGDAEDRG